MSKPWPSKACANLNIELWFDESEFSERRAKAICKSCPALEPCRAEALQKTARLAARGLQHRDLGILGGLTPAERASLVTGRHSTVGHMTPEGDKDG